MTFKPLIPLILDQWLLSACSFMEPHAKDVDLDVQHGHWLSTLRKKPTNCRPGLGSIKNS
jgi:hypothetical protein